MQGCDGMSPRWMVEKAFANQDREVLRTVIVYAEGENKELVKKENRGTRHQRKLISWIKE